MGGVTLLHNYRPSPCRGCTYDGAQQPQAGGVALPRVPGALPPGGGQGDAQTDGPVEFAPPRLDGDHGAKVGLAAQQLCNQLIWDWLSLRFKTTGEMAGEGGRGHPRARRVGGGHERSRCVGIKYRCDVKAGGECDGRRIKEMREDKKEKGGEKDKIPKVNYIFSHLGKNQWQHSSAGRLLNFSFLLQNVSIDLTIITIEISQLLLQP